jgi:hypothetical protein
LTPEEAIIRGEKASRLLQDPLFLEASEKLEKDVMEAWAKTPIRDKEGQHELLLMIQTARKFKAIFAEMVATGEYHKQQLQTPKLKRTLERFGVYNP